MQTLLQNILIREEFDVSHGFVVLKSYSELGVQNSARYTNTGILIR